MKPGYVIGLVVAGFVVGGLVCRPDRTQEAAQHRADSLAVVVETLIVQDTARALAARADADTIAGQRALIRKLGRIAQSAGTKGDSLTKVLQAWADSMVPKTLALAAVAAKDVVISSQALQIGALERTNAIEARRRGAADSAAAAWRQVALNLQIELRGALKRAGRRWGCTAGVGATAGISQYAAGIGFTCGRKFF